MTCPRLVRHCLCNSGIGVGSLPALAGCSVAEGRMWPVGAVVLAVVLGHGFGLRQSMKQLYGKELVAKFAVAGFHECVLSR